MPLNYRAWGIPAIFSRPCQERSESVSGVFPEFLRNFCRKVPAVLGALPRLGCGPVAWRDDLWSRVSWRGCRDFFNERRGGIQWMRAQKKSEEVYRKGNSLKRSEAIQWITGLVAPYRAILRCYLRRLSRASTRKICPKWGSRKATKKQRKTPKHCFSKQMRATKKPRKSQLFKGG